MPSSPLGEEQPTIASPKIASGVRYRPDARSGDASRLLVRLDVLVRDEAQQVAHALVLDHRVNLHDSDSVAIVPLHGVSS